MLRAHDLGLDEELDGPVARAVEPDLGPAEEAEAEAETDLGAPVEAEEVGSRGRRSRRRPSGRGEAVGEAEGELVAGEPEVRGQGDDVEVGLRGVDFEVVGSATGRRGRARLARGACASRLARRGRHEPRMRLREAGEFVPARKTTLGASLPRPCRDHESVPFIFLCPGPQYSEHLISNVPGFAGHEFRGHRRSPLRDLDLHVQLGDRDAVLPVRGVQGELDAVALGDLDASPAELEARCGDRRIPLRPLVARTRRVAPSAERQIRRGRR